MLARAALATCIPYALQHTVEDTPSRKETRE
jgi:hypothetical protein